jgi:prevent-host-death family protein
MWYKLAHEAPMTLQELEAIAGEHTRPASDVESQWHSIVEEANEFGEVVVTNDNGPEVVVMSVEQFVNLKKQADPMTRLRAQWDRELAVLREPGAGDLLRKIFASTPEEIADAANAARSQMKSRK